MTEPGCAHLNIRYAPKSLKNHSYQERWMCSDCDSEFLPKSRFDKVRVDAHTAGANEMVERCHQHLLGQAREFGGIDKFDDTLSDYLREIAFKLLLFSPDPNYLQGKIEASTKELRKALENLINVIKDAETVTIWCGEQDEGENLRATDEYEKARQALKETE